MNTNENLCEDCGHLQVRHIHGHGFCTVNIPNTVGIGYLACRCPIFKPKVETEDIDANQHLLAYLDALALKVKNYHDRLKEERLLDRRQSREYHPNS